MKSRRVRKEVIDLSGKPPRYGYRRIRALLRREGFEVNAKWIARMRREEGLNVSKKQRRMKRVEVSTSEGRRATRAREVWSWDFVGEQTEHGHIESFHDKLRDERLKRELFGSLMEARGIVESWGVEYSDLRPHSSLGYLSPSEYMRKKQSDRGCAPPTPVPLGAAGDRGELGARAPWRQEIQAKKQTADL